ncbi:MAG: LPS export ABC transporter periplasmic protein LptC [Chthoniobacterales bacterium]
MRRCLKFGVLALGLITMQLAPAETPATSPKPAKSEKSDKADKADKAAQLDNQAGKINIAVPLNQPVKGLHLPFYDFMGRLKMQFDAETANRTTDNVVEMKALKVETFDDKGQRDMLVHFPTATYDLSSSVIKSDDSVEVRRNDFVLTGVGMEFDSKKRAGRVLSKIRMEIFNRSAETSEPSPTPTPNGP